MVSVFAPQDIDELLIAGADGPAEVRQTLGKVGIEAVLLRHDAPILVLPQVDIQFAAVTDADITLLEPLSPAIGHLSTQVGRQSIQLHRCQLSLHLTLRHCPETVIPYLCGE